MACNYNCTALPEHVRVECGEYRKGGISAIGILSCEHTITDFNDQTQLDAAIADGTLNIIKSIKGQIPEAAPVLNPNPVGCGSENILDGYDQTATWTDANVSDSVISYYNALNRRTQELAIFHCEDAEVTVVSDTVTFECHRVVSESNKENQMFACTASWSGFDMPPLEATIAAVWE